MILTRKHRTKQFREQVEHEWKEKFWKFIENLPEKSWDWNGLSENPNITFDIVQSYPEQPWKWGMYGLSENPNITFDIVLAHPDKSWDWISLSNVIFGCCDKLYQDQGLSG